MRRLRMILGGAVLVAALAGGVASAQGQPDNGNDDSPVFVDAPWAGAVVIGIIGVVFAAAVIGLTVRLHAPPTHSHDEPPGSSGHHGKSGTIQPEK